MHVAVFKYNKSFASLYSKLLFLFPSWLVLQNFGFDLTFKWDVEAYQMEVMTK